MSLIVENGSIVDNANSYVTRAEYIAYAASIGVVVANDAQADAQLVRASAFIDSLELKLKGSRVDRNQLLAFPRTGLIIENFPWDADEIPRQVILAQMALALDIRSGVDPYNPASNLPIIEERVDGAVAIRYASPSTVTKLNVRSSATALINSLLKNNGLFNITLDRR